MDNETVVFPAAGEVTLEDRPVPDPEPGEVLIETTASLVSTGTELTLLSGEFPPESAWSVHGDYPVVTGYCNVGKVVETGANVSEVAEGNLVASKTPHQRFVTADVDSIAPIPNDVSPDAASFFALAGIAMNGIRKGELEWGESMACYGLGLVGQLAVRFALVAGVRPVVGFDVATDRLDYLPDDPAVVGVDPTATNPAELVRDHNHGRLADAVYECTGNPSVIPGEFDVLREQGRLVVLSSPRGPTELDLHDVCNAPSYSIIGAHDYSHPTHETPQTPWTYWRHYELFFDLLSAGALDTKSLISHRIAPGDAPATYERLLDDRTDTMGAIIEW